MEFVTETGFKARATGIRVDSCCLDANHPDAIKAAEAFLDEARAAAKRIEEEKQWVYFTHMAMNYRATKDLSLIECRLTTGDWITSAHQKYSTLVPREIVESIIKALYINV